MPLIDLTNCKFLICSFSFLFFLFCTLFLVLNVFGAFLVVGGYPCNECRGEIRLCHLGATIPELQNIPRLARPFLSLFSPISLLHHVFIY